MKTLRRRLEWIALGAVVWSALGHRGETWHHIGTAVYVGGLGTAWFLSCVLPRKYR